MKLVIFQQLIETWSFLGLLYCMIVVICG